MGLFSFFTNKKEQPQAVVKDIIWMSAAAKKQGCLKVLQEHPNAILLAWFQQTQQEWQDFMTQHHKTNAVVLMRNVHGAMLADKQIILLEHFPMASKETAFLETLPKQEVIVLTALDEPLMTTFGGGKILELMLKMGMKEDEAIEHSMITNSIKKAQQKLEEKVVAERSAVSAAEWFSINAN